MAANPLELFNPSVRVFGSPSRYVQGIGALGLVASCAATLGKRLVLLADAQVLSLVGEQIEADCKSTGLPFYHQIFDGELTPESGQRLVEQCALQKSDVLVAAGGGRGIDAGKAMAESSGSALITLPTVASNDAPTSKNFVLYDNDHRLLEVRHLFRNPDYVIVDSSILAQAPKHFFLAGLGDAIAKKFEAEQCFHSDGVNMFAASPTRLALAIAEQCYQTLLEQGDAAYKVAGTGEVTADFDAAVEAMILMAGLGFESGGLSVSHALTRGLSLIPSVKQAPHGLQVAYGLLVQLALEGTDIPDELAEFYRDTGLPQSLAMLGATDPSIDDFRVIAETTVSVPHMKNFSCRVEPEALIVAMSKVESEAKC